MICHGDKRVSQKGDYLCEWRGALSVSLKGLKPKPCMCHHGDDYTLYQSDDDDDIYPHRCCTIVWGSHLPCSECPCVSELSVLVLRLEEQMMTFTIVMLQCHPLMFQDE